MSVKFADQNETIIIDEQEEETGEVSKEDENRFSILCNSVNNCMCLIQNSHSELLEFQSILLKENIAPSVLVKLSLINGKIFRSISDLHNPLGELVRLVKVYAEPWEKKSKALRKLHKDYEKKANQLNVALKKLTRHNEETKRISKRDNLQNWEQLFTRVQLDRSHGRRWKYRMFEFKQKMKIDNLHDYFQKLIDEEDGIIPVIGDVTTEQSEMETGPKSQIVETQKSNFESISLNDLEEKVSDEEEYQESIEDQEDVRSPEPIEMVNASVGTSDANFSQKLIMRIYNPKGLENLSILRCRIIYGDKFFETENLDKSQQEKEEEAKIEKEIADALLESEKSKGGLIGKRKLKQTQLPEKSREQIKKEQTAKKLRSLARNEEVEILIPNDVTSGINKDSEYQSIKLVLFENNNIDNKVAQATIDLEEIQELDLPVFKEHMYQGDLVSPPATANIDEKPFPNLEPMTFPLYEYQDTFEPSNQIGQLPISCFFSRREEQIVFHRVTEMQSINQLVEELTGINLDKFTKDELNREKADKCVSPRPESPRSEMVSKSKMDILISQHQLELKSLRESYENKMKEILAEIEHSKEKDIIRPTGASRIKQSSAKNLGKKREENNSGQKFSKPYSSKSKDTLSTSGPDEQEEILYSCYESEKKVKDMDYTSDLPNDFLERVSFYSQISNQHKNELATKIKSEISKAIEDKLTELYRIHADLTEEDVSSVLADLCMPAMFMPFANSSGTIYNPRAHQYFHPNGLRNLRLSQAPSIFKLPPIRNNQISILNLFDIGNQMQIRRVENNASNETSIKRVLKTNVTNFIQTESTRSLSNTELN